MGICAEASAEKSREAIAERFALAVAVALADADADADAAKAAEAAAMALAERFTEAKALSGASMAEIWAVREAPAQRLIPELRKVVSDDRNAARAAKAPTGIFSGNESAAKALREPTMALTPAEAVRLTPRLAARLATIESWLLALKVALADTAALTDAVAEADNAAVRATAALGARRLTPSDAFTLQALHSLA